MENWRLSKIEEELGRLHLDSMNRDKSQSPPTSPSQLANDSHTNTPNETEDDICSKIIIRPAYKKPSRSKEDKHRAAVQRIKEKYDSLNTVVKLDIGSDKQRSPNETSVAVGSPPPVHLELQSPPLTLTIDDRPAVDKDAQFNGTASHVLLQDSKFNGSAPQVFLQDPVVLTNCLRRENATVSFQEMPSVGESFGFRASKIPPFPSEQFDRTPQQSVTRTKPPTAAKPLCSSFRGDTAVDNTRLSQSDSSPKIYMVPEVPEVSIRPSNLPEVQSFAQNSTIGHMEKLSPLRNDHFPVDVYPDPPPDFFLHHNDQELSVRLSNPPEIIAPSPVPGSPKAVALETPFPKHEDLVINTNGPSGQWGYGPVSQRDSLGSNFISTETQKPQHFTTSSHNDCFPRYGTLRATSHHAHSTNSQTMCDFLPPGGPPLADEDRNQVEMFYRSHKTKVFASKCEANLFVGSARRHSSILPSKSASLRAAESPENWAFVKRGVPVLVLDTGESRRQRRLHIILAEKGSGFVLWRDTVDHLTGYSMSADAGFHTMHLSKDHTKLAGLFFSDPLFATDFYDYLSNLTSDPEDPLLNLSLGARRRKDRKSSSSTKRKDKRKAIKREDISMPCCFTHVTKMDRADGLSLLESEEQRLLDS